MNWEASLQKMLKQIIDVHNNSEMVYFILYAYGLMDYHCKRVLCIVMEKWPDIFIPKCCNVLSWKNGLTYYLCKRVLCSVTEKWPDILPLQKGVVYCHGKMAPQITIAKGCCVLSWKNDLIYYQ